jgi:hypothetical protein
MKLATRALIMWGLRALMFEDVRLIGMVRFHVCPLCICHEMHWTSRRPEATQAPHETASIKCISIQSPKRLMLEENCQVRHRFYY